MLYPIMPVYLKSIGFSILLIGILEGIAEATAGLSKGYFGKLSDVRGQRVPFVRWGYILSAVSKPMMAIFTFPVWIFFARTLDRFGKGIRTSARDAMLSDETTPEHKGKVFGFHRSMDTVGASIGPFLALIFLYFYPEQYTWLFFIAFGPGMVAMLLTLFLKDKKAEELKSSKAEELKSLRVDEKKHSLAHQHISTSAHQPISTSTHQHISTSAHQLNFFSYFKYWSHATKQYKLLIIGLLAFTLFNSSDAFLLLALKEQGLSDSHMIGFYIFYNLVFALLAYPIGVIADKLGLKSMLIMGLFIFSGVYFFFGFASSFLAFTLLFFFYGIYAASTEGISKALISNLAAKTETATAIGFYTSFASIFTMLASSLAGLLWYSIGPKAMFMISGLGVLVVGIYLSCVLSKR